MMQCPKCQIEVKDGQKFCGKCGTPIQVQEDLKGQRVEMSQPQTPTEAKSHKILLMKWKILLIPIAILFSAALGIGGTYFFLINKGEPVITEPTPVMKMEEEEQEIEIEAMTVEEVAAIVDRISTGLRNEKRTIGEKYNLFYTGDVTDTIYEELKQNLLPYASKANVEGALKETFYATCFDCDIIDFPYPTNYALEVDFQQQGKEKIIFNATYAGDGMTPAAREEIVQLVFEDGDWKYEGFTISIIDLQLTLETAMEIAEMSEIYNGVSFVEAKDDSYIFSTDQGHIEIMKDSGMIYQYEMPKVERAQSQPHSKQSTRLKSSYTARLDKAEALAASYSATEETTIGYIEAYTQQYVVWDDLLNELYGEIKAQMSESEFIKLRDIQRAWIKERDDAADRAAAEYEGGSLAGIVYSETLVTYTRDRCYELVALYLSN